jgi:hypothetical protein
MGNSAMGDSAMGDGTGGISGASGRPGTTGTSGRPRRGWVVALVCGGLPAALLAAIVAVPAALWSRLPGRVADHWTLAGNADGTAPRLVPVATFGALALIGAGLVWLGWVLGRRGAPGWMNAPRRWRGAGAGGAVMLVPVGVFVMAISAGSVLLVVAANLGGGGLLSASVGYGPLFGLVGGPALLASGAGYALRHFAGLGPADDGAARPSLGLRAGERAVWSGGARAGWAWPAAALLSVAGALTGALGGQWGPGVLLLVTGVLMLGFTAVRVRVAARGVTVGYGPLGLRLTRIPLRRIAAAAVVERTGFSFGYRGSLALFGAAAVMVRRGPALRLALRDGKTFLVTVDDAATGAALLNDLISAAV